MRNTLAIQWVLLVALLGSCSSQSITSSEPTTKPDDNAEQARTQEEIVPASMKWADRPSPEAAVNQRRALGTPPRLLPYAVLVGHTAEVRHARFSPDGSRIVTTSDDGTARLWDSEGKELAVFAPGGGLFVAFNPDGSRILLGTRLFRVPATPHNSSTGPAAIDAPALLRFKHGYMADGMYNGGLGPD